MTARLVDSPEAAAAVFSAPPLVSTAGFQRQGLHLDYRREPPGEIDPVAAPWHVVVVFTRLPETTVAERYLDDRFRVEPVHPGDVVVIPAYTGHGVRWNEAGEFLCLILEPATLAQSLGEDRQVLLKPHFAQPDPLMLQLGLALKRLAASTDSADTLYGEPLSQTLAVHLLQRYGHRSPTLRTAAAGLAPAQLAQVQAYIRAYLAQPIHLEQLAALVNLSPHYFCQLFKRSTGQSPHQYLIACRLEKARQLLRHSQLSIADIACQSGFAHQSHLHRHFKRQLGVTPGQYRRG